MKPLDESCRDSVPDDQPLCPRKLRQAAGVSARDHVDINHNTSPLYLPLYLLAPPFSLGNDRSGGSTTSMLLIILAGGQPPSPVDDYFYERLVRILAAIQGRQFGLI